jgi:pyruvate dehydrogenase E1 component alpha subunit
MHMSDLSVGILGTNGIVGAGIPLAIGAALSAKVLSDGKVSVSFFGDSNTNQGAWHEGVNMAAVLDLPCVFVCENNLYGCTTSTAYSMRVKNIAERTVDGQNVADVEAVARKAVARARAGGGPTLIEALTYRYYGHFEGDNLKYRPRGEEEPWRQRDPLKVFARELAPAVGITPEELQAADQRAAERVAQATQFAKSSPLPAPEECLLDVYETY